MRLRQPQVTRRARAADDDGDDDGDDDDDDDDDGDDDEDDDDDDDDDDDGDVQSWNVPVGRSNVELELCTTMRF